MRGAADRMRGGFVLPVTVFMMLVVAAVVGATVGFVSHAARQTRVHLARSRCRLAAQSAIEYAKARIQDGFSDFAGGSGAASVKIDPRQAEVYDWFDKVDVSSNRCVIGSGTTHEVVIEAGQRDKVNGCSVTFGIGENAQDGSRPGRRRSDGDPVAEVALFATASYVYQDGLKVEVTLMERVVFGTGQSPVFDYAYFVNNYGWMSGSTITINGDMRANGNVSLSQSTVNGRIYAAANDELGVKGEVTLSGSPRIKGTSDYRSAASSRARPDVADYNVKGAYDAPSQSGVIRKPTYYSDQYDEDGRWRPVAVDGTGTRGETSGATIVNEGSDSLPMPFVSDLDAYVEYAESYVRSDGGKGGRLSYPAVSYTDAAGETKTVSGGTVSGHYTGTGPSGDPTAADNGALVLVGTLADPIVIDGPVVVDSDVVIKGYVKGQGTIYSGRNVHVIGDVKYVSPPNWGHVDADDAAVAQANAKKDMLGLVAKGNIVCGDSSDSTWHNSVDRYIRGKAVSSSSVVNSYACDESDANIGYPSTFAGDYTAVEQVSGLSSKMAASAPGGYDAASGQFGKLRSVTVELDTYHEEAYYDRWGRYMGTKSVRDTKTELQTSYDRRYYETVCDDYVLKSLKDSAVMQIDAVVYNNHGAFGTLGRNGYYVNVNGSLICRDEALIYTASGLRFNWDMRLKSKETQSTLSLPVGPVDPYVSEWMQVPEKMNPAYPKGSN